MTTNVGHGTQSESRKQAGWPSPARGSNSAPVDETTGPSPARSGGDSAMAFELEANAKLTEAQAFLAATQLQCAQLLVEACAEASQIIGDAQGSAEQILNEARESAHRILAEANGRRSGVDTRPRVSSRFSELWEVAEEERDLDDFFRAIPERDAEDVFKA